MPKKKNTQKPAKSQKTWFKRLVITAAKLAFAVSCALVIFVIYLDAKVQRTFEGQRWQVPAQIYGKIESLRIGDSIDISLITKSLKINGYSKVSTTYSPGQFAQSSRRLIIYRRAFAFPNSDQDFTDGASEAVRLTIDFNNNQVSKLFIDDIAVEKIKLEPILLARLVPNNKEDRVLVALENMPTLLLDTLLLIEDRDFYHHQGLSPLGILRALYNNIIAGRTVQGGSTLTQQLVKNMFLTRERTLIRKVKEAIMALIIEVRYSKDQLLEAYINEVYLGQHYANGIYGFGLASTFYFGKPVEELSSGQMALLVAQVKGPSYYDPWKHPERAIQRRDLILRLMFEQNLLSVKEFEQSLNTSLSIRKNRRFKTEKYPAYLQVVKQELNQHLSAYQQKMGIRVFTGFSHVTQQLLEESVVNQLTQLEKKHKQKDLQAAMIVTDIASAELRAIVGDRQSGLAGFNRALGAKRPVGSLIKPAIYMAALERFEQFNLATLLADEPITLRSDSADNSQGKKWQPKNYDGKYRHQVPLIDGLVKSLNIPTVNLGMSLGLENVADAIHLLGFEEDIITRPSMLLGSINMSPMQINQLYLPFANHGELAPVHAINKVVSSYGETLWQVESDFTRVISKDVSYLMDYALMQVAVSGTAKSLSWRLKSNKVAGKTGTSNDLRDSWFIGFDEKNLVTTWVGKDNNKSTGLTGSSGALLLFSDYIKKQGVVDKVNNPPETIAMTVFESKTGNVVTSNCANTQMYPAVLAGISISNECLQEKAGAVSWFKKLFSFN